MASHNSIQKKTIKWGKIANMEERQRKKRAMEKDRNTFANEVKIVACARAWKTKKAVSD